MKIVVFGPHRRVGALDRDTVIDLSRAFAKFVRETQSEPHPEALAMAFVPPDLAGFIEGGRRALDGAAQAIEYLASNAHDRSDPAGEPVAWGTNTVQLHAPCVPGARIACAGGNFADHAAAMYEKLSPANATPLTRDNAAQQIRNSGIWGFWKVGRDIGGQDATVIYPASTNRLDYEAEIAIVLGRKAKDARASDLRQYVWGVTMLADWSNRNLKSEAPGPLKFGMVKNFDTSCSVGPCIVVDEVDPSAVDIALFVNGEQRQNFNTRDMVFSFGEYLEYLSRDFTLHPGDLISGGTAAGTAADSSALLSDRTPSPDRFLKPGDRVELRSPVIGSLRASVVAKPQA
jgi:2-keto-4-pentenoate hydratase/2-oxohepta-3-ene-1,7-dioic acid hydratase in catechol pathway